MKDTILNVEGMSCMHCVKAVKGALESLQGVDEVSVDLKAKTVTVKHDPELASIDNIKNEIDDLGFEVIS